MVAEGAGVSVGLCLISDLAGLGSVGLLAVAVGVSLAIAGDVEGPAYADAGLSVVVATTLLRAYTLFLRQVAASKAFAAGTPVVVEAGRVVAAA